jgi:glycosyltransferase involved in cell wall biosynthesis
MPVVLDARVVKGSGGGPDKTIFKSPRFLRPAGYRMLCAYMHAPGDPGFAQLREKAERWEAPLLSVADRGPLDPRVFTQLLALCRRQRVAVWHGHDYKSNLLGLLLRPFWPMRLVTTLHGWVEYTRRTPLYYHIDRLCLPRYERVICVSPDLHEQARAAGVPAGRCVLVENGIDLVEFARGRSTDEAKRLEGFTPGRLLVGAVGRLSAEKCFDVLIRALAQVVRAGLDVELAIVGEGGQKAELEALSAEVGVRERVRLLGYRSDPRALYEALDVFALSSLREGLPNVLLEALSMEVSAVATRIAGVPRLLRDGENGLLVEPGSVDGLAGALLRLLRDADLRARLAAAGRRTVENDYSFAARMEKIAGIYDSLLGRPPGGDRNRGAPSSLALR